MVPLKIRVPRLEKSFGQGEEQERRGLRPFSSNEEGPLQLLGHLDKLKGICTYFGNNQDILGRGYIYLARAKELSQYSFHAIPHDRFAKAACDCDTEPGPPPWRGGAHHHEMGTVSPLPTLLQREKLPAYQQTRGLGERIALPLRIQRCACLGGIETVKRLRPLARRRLRTARPAAVLIRVRNPCVRLRRRLLG